MDNLDINQNMNDLGMNKNMNFNDVNVQETMDEAISEALNKAIAEAIDRAPFETLDEWISHVNQLISNLIESNDSIIMDDSHRHLILRKYLDALDKAILLKAISLSRLAPLGTIITIHFLIIFRNLVVLFLNNFPNDGSVSHIRFISDFMVYWMSVILKFIYDFGISSNNSIEELRWAIAIVLLMLALITLLYREVRFIKFLLRNFRQYLSLRKKRKIILQKIFKNTIYFRGGDKGLIRKIKRFFKSKSRHFVRIKHGCRIIFISAVFCLKYQYSDIKINSSNLLNSNVINSSRLINSNYHEDSCKIPRSITIGRETSPKVLLIKEKSNISPLLVKPNLELVSIPEVVDNNSKLLEDYKIIIQPIPNQQIILPTQIKTKERFARKLKYHLLKQQFLKQRFLKALDS